MVTAPSLTQEQQERASRLQAAGVAMEKIVESIQAAYDEVFEDYEDLAASQPVLERCLSGEERTYTRAELRAELGLDA